MNIILIGMPGCGKTSVGKVLAERLSLEFVCTDEYVEEITGMRIPEIFEARGEEYFREREAEAVAELTGRANAVISTGGGAVLRLENRGRIAKSGIVVWLKREISELSRDDRPLSTSMEALREMYRQRAGVYERLADVVIEVCGGVEDVVEDVVERVGERRTPGEGGFCQVSKASPGIRAAYSKDHIPPGGGD